MNPRAFAAALLFGSLSLAACAVDPGADADADPASTEDALKAWDVKQLRPISAAQAKVLGAAAHDVKFVRPGGTAPLGVAWAWIQENCNRRADLVNFALAQGSAAVLPDPTPASLITSTLKAPKFDSALIYLTGPLNVSQQFVMPDGKALPKTSLATWDHHIAAVVNVDGTTMVLDPSLKSEPVAIDAWIHAYVPSDLACPRLDDATWGNTDRYYMARWQFAVDKPAHACGYKFEKAYNFEATEKVTAAGVKKELDDARELLGAGVDDLQTTLQDGTKHPVDVAVLPRVTSVLTPLTDQQTCKQMNYAFKWCAEYKR
jgi:hypothetical protein